MEGAGEDYEPCFKFLAAGREGGQVEEGTSKGVFFYQDDRLIIINSVNRMNVGFKAQERIERNKEWKKRRREEAEQVEGGGRRDLAPLSSLSGGR